MFRCVFNRMTVGRKLFAILAIGAGALLASGGIAAMCKRPVYPYLSGGVGWNLSVQFSWEASHGKAGTRPR